jgi:hypothetical protein
MLRLLLLCISLLVAAAAQSPAPQPPTTQPVDHLAVARFVSQLDTLIAQLSAAKESTEKAAAMRHAADDDDDVKKQLASTDALLTERIESLRARRAKLAEVLPPQFSDPVAWVRQEASKAWDLKDLRDTVSNLTALDQKLAKDVAAAKQPEWLARETERASMLATYYVAMALRRQADSEASSKNNAAQAVTTRIAARKKLDGITGRSKELDFSYSGEGTSLLAAASWTSIRTNIALQWAYAKLAESDPVKYGPSAASTRTEVLDAFERLERRFGSDHSANGQSFAEELRRDVDALRARR